MPDSRSGVGSQFSGVAYNHYKTGVPLWYLPFSLHLLSPKPHSNQVFNINPPNSPPHNLPHTPSYSNHTARQYYSQLSQVSPSRRLDPPFTLPSLAHPHNTSTPHCPHPQSLLSLDYRGTRMIGAKGGTRSAKMRL